MLILSQVHRIMITATQVPDMKTADGQTKTQDTGRKTRLSPELNEFLHMLKALESELDSKAQTVR